MRIIKICFNGCVTSTDSDYKKCFKDCNDYGLREKKKEGS